MIDFDLQRCTRQCFVTQRELKPGEAIYSVLLSERGHVVRHDYALEAWSGPPAGAIGAWKSTVAEPSAKKMQWAPNDVMVGYLEQLEGDPNRADVRYVLALLLVRRRVARVEETAKDEAGGETLVIYCPRNEVEYRIPVAFPTAERATAIQQELGQLLQAPAA